MTRAITHIQDQYRPSASAILAAQLDTTDKNVYDYEVLLLMRSERTAYAPKHCVFPGGVFDATADESPAWIEYFHKFGVKQQQLDQLTQQKSSPSPSSLLASGCHFSREISLRITALRETFEEVGVLLCRDKKSVQRITTSCEAYEQEEFNREHWQRRVHEDPRQFFQLCLKLKVVPDLWCLHEWSIWRSPITASKKYDTVFYFAALEKQPALLLERSEVKEAQWRNPVSFLKVHTQGNIWLPPLQVYELSRLANAHKYSNLLRFTKARSQHGSTLLLPVYYRCTDALVGTLPGDDYYPANPMIPLDNNVLDFSVEELCQRTQRHHRIIIYGMHNIKIQTNIPPIDEHLSVTKTNFDFSKL